MKYDFRSCRHTISSTFVQQQRVDRVGPIFFYVFSSTSLTVSAAASITRMTTALGQYSIYGLESFVDCLRNIDLLRGTRRKKRLSLCTIAELGAQNISWSVVRGVLKPERGVQVLNFNFICAMTVYRTRVRNIVVMFKYTSVRPILCAVQYPYKGFTIIIYNRLYDALLLYIYFIIRLCVFIIFDTIFNGKNEYGNNLYNVCI